MLRVDGELMLVQNERQVEAESARGARALNLRRLVAGMATRASGLTPTTVEMTRLLTHHLVGHSHALALAFDEGIGALRRAGVSPMMLRSLVAPRAARFAKLMESADSWLEKCGLRDERADARLAATALGAEPVPEFEQVEQAVLRGLGHWENADLEFFEGVHQNIRGRNGRGLVIELPTARAFRAKSGMESLLTKLERRWAAQPDSPSIDFVEPDQPGQETVIEAQHAESEARVVAHAVLDALSRGTPVDGIAVVTLDSSQSFLEPLRTELNLAKIPFTEPRGRPAVASPRAHAALELLKLARGALTRDGLVDLLLTPDLRPERWLQTRERRALHRLVRELERLPLNTDSSGTELLGALAEPDGSEVRSLAHAALKRMLLDLEYLKGPSQRSRLGSAWRSLLDALGMLETNPNALERGLDVANATELLQSLGDDAAGLRALLTAVERTESAAAALGFGDQQLLAGEYLQEIEAALTGVGPATGAGRAGAVWVARPADVAGLRHEVVVVCRASKSHLDCSTSSAELSLGEPLMQALPWSLRPPAAMEQAGFAELGLAWATVHASRVVVTFSRDETGNRDGPSRWTEALRGYPKRHLEPTSPLHSGARRVRALAAPNGGALRRMRVERARSDFFLRRAGEDPYTGRAPSLPRLVRGDSPEHPVAVTTLERYLRCPFLAFAEAGLRATRRSEDGDTIDARIRGRLLHQSLAAGMEAASRLPSNASASERQAAALNAAEVYLTSQGRSPLRRAAMQNLVADAAALIRWSAGADDPLLFLEAERAFGQAEKWGPLALEGVYVSGRIDRIDASPSRKRLRIIDYKSGGQPTRKEWHHELLQPW
ncbi:MAG TPA: PD-(D/E)XK nuclease family protein, partial [Polyangiaceae bacterium]